jgi:hypothetical protein
MRSIRTSTIAARTAMLQAASAPSRALPPVDGIHRGQCTMESARCVGIQVLTGVEQGMEMLTTDERCARMPTVPTPTLACTVVPVIDHVAPLIMRSATTYDRHRSSEQSTTRLRCRSRPYSRAYPLASLGITTVFPLRPPRPPRLTIRHDRQRATNGSTPPPGLHDDPNMLTCPSVPSTRIRCPSRIRRVAFSTPTTAGKPYSRAITAP